MMPSAGASRRKGLRRSYLPASGWRGNNFTSLLSLPDNDAEGHSPAMLSSRLGLRARVSELSRCPRCRLNRSHPTHSTVSGRK